VYLVCNTSFVRTVKCQILLEVLFSILQLRVLLLPNFYILFICLFAFLLLSICFLSILLKHIILQNIKSHIFFTHQLKVVMIIKQPK